MTKKEAKARKAAWTQALNERRVVSFANGERMTAYLTAADAEEAVAKALAVGMPAKIVG